MFEKDVCQMPSICSFYSVNIHSSISHMSQFYSVEFMRWLDFRAQHNCDLDYLMGHNAYQTLSSCIHYTEIIYHNDVIKWKHFLRYWLYVRGIHRSPVKSPHKGQWYGALMFSLICVWINGWVNNGEAGDLKRYRAHYNVTVMYMVISIYGFAHDTHHEQKFISDPFPMTRTFSGGIQFCLRNFL